MRKLSLCFLALISTLAISSCQKDENPSSKTNDAVGQVSSDRKLVSSNLVKSASLSDVINECESKLSNTVELSDSSFTEIFKASFLGRDIVDFEIVTYNIKYNSVVRDEKGEHPTVLSGAVSFIADRAGLLKERRLESVSLVNTIFNTSAEDVTLLHFLFQIRTIYNALLVYPYYQGGDVNDGNVVAPSEFLYKGKQAIDCELAALELLDKLSGVRMGNGYYTEIIGLSNGGGPSLAAQFLLENDEKYKECADKINLRSTYIGEGNCDCAAIFPYMLCKSKRPSLINVADVEALAPVAYISFVAGAYMTWKDLHFCGAEIENYFSDKLLNHVDSVSGKNPLEQYLTNDGSLMFDAMNKTDNLSIFETVNPNLLAFDPADSSYSFKSGTILDYVYDAFDENDIIRSGWKPKALLTFAHSHDDEFVPYKSIFAIWKNLSCYGLNPNVRLDTIWLLNHMESSFFLTARDALLKKHPAEKQDK